MDILRGLFFIIFGVLWIWMGSVQFILGMMPHDIGMKAAEAHGAWVRENILKLPPVMEKK